MMEIIKKKKKVLVVCTVISFIEWFNKENIAYLNNQCGYEVHIATNFDYMNDTDPDRTKKYISNIKKDGVILHNIPFARSPFSISNIKCYFQIKKIIESISFSLIHVHTPTASIITRLAARNIRKHGTKVMYTCHGFHFHKASPKINWILYYPIEKYMSRYCDYLITINKEDFGRAQNFFASNVRYIPGVGVDIDKIQKCHINKQEYKEKLGLPKDCFLILSIGELIPRKNHEIIIKALAIIENPNVYYTICGKGPLKEELISLATALGVKEQVKILGFRNDIPELCNVADISAFPSIIEGLGLAGIEAMAAGIPLISSNVHGILDYVIDGDTGYACDPHNANSFAVAIDTLIRNPTLRATMSEKCKKAVEPFKLQNALNEMWRIYDEILKVD